MSKTSTPYIGRFAPSPSGPLHFGSLVAAMASYLDARAHDGTWLVRIEDIDPPREPRGASGLILQALEAYGMLWDRDVLFQSNRHSAYDDVLTVLQQEHKLYPCTCTRKKLAGHNGVYPGYCRNVWQDTAPGEPHGLRLLCRDTTIHFQDRIQGEQSYNLTVLGDFLLKRKDSLYAYQLAVCVDDAFQGVTHIVRGVDLLDSTPRQLYLQSQLSMAHPVYAHIPVITLGDGNKLSKQNHAPAIPLDNPRPTLMKALRALGLETEPDLQACTIADILDWGVQHWSLDSLLGKKALLLAALD